VIMLVAFAPLVAAQLKAAANAFEVLLGIPYLTALFVFGAIVIVYTVVGGMHAVAWTDLIQGTIMIVGFGVLAPVAVTAAGGFAEMHDNRLVLVADEIVPVAEIDPAAAKSRFDAAVAAIAEPGMHSPEARERLEHEREVAAAALSLAGSAG